MADGQSITSTGNALPYAAAFGAGLAGTESPTKISIEQAQAARELQQSQMEALQARQALTSEQNYQTFVDQQPKEDQAMLRGLPAEQRGAVIQDRIEAQQWKRMTANAHFLSQFGLTPDDVASIRELGPKVGGPLLAGTISAARAQNLQQVKDINQMARTQLEAQSHVEAAKISGGARVEAANISAAARRDTAGVDKAQKASDALDSKATTAIQREYDKMKAANEKANTGVRAAMGYPKLPHPDLPDTFEDYLDSDEGKKAFATVRGRMASMAAKSSDPAKPSPSDKLKAAALPKAKPPKALWGKTGTINGKRVKIDNEGNVSPL